MQLITSTLSEKTIKKCQFIVAGVCRGNVKVLILSPKMLTVFQHLIVSSQSVIKIIMTLNARRSIYVKKLYNTVGKLTVF